MRVFAGQAMHGCKVLAVLVATGVVWLSCAGSALADSYLPSNVAASPTAVALTPAGGTTHATATITNGSRPNGGTAHAGTVRFLLTKVAKGGSGVATEVGQVATPVLALGRSGPVGTDLHIPASLGAGSFTLTACTVEPGTPTPFVIQEDVNDASCVDAARALTLSIAPAKLSISPASASFPPTGIGVSSAPQTFTITNSGGQTTGVPTSPVLAGTAAADYVLTSACHAALAPGASCTVSAVFKPTRTGSRPATFTLRATPGGTVTGSLSGTGSIVPHLTINPLSKDFGTIARGTSPITQVFTVKNDGGATTSAVTVVVSGVDAALFVATNHCPSTIAAGGQCTVDVVFSPTVNGSKAASLGVSAATGGTLSAPLSANVVDPAHLTIAPASWDFGTVARGTTAPVKAFTITNTGGVPTSALSVALSGAPFSATGTNNCSGAVLAAAGQCTVTLQMVTTFNSVGNGSVNVSATTGGSAPATLTGSVVDPAQLTIDTNSADFGDVIKGSSPAAKTFTVTNAGGVPTGALSVSAGNGPFSASGCSGTLAAGAHCTVSVTLSTQTVGSASGSLTVSATPGASVGATLAANIVNPAHLTIDPESKDFQTVARDSVALSQTFTVSNTGGAAALGVAPAITGTDSALFAVTNNNCPATMNAAASCTVTVTFTPSSNGAKSATLTVSGTPGGSAVATLSANVVDPAAISVTSGSGDFGTVVRGTSPAPRSFTIKNTGGVPTTVLSATADSPFSAGNGCDGVLGAGLSCTVTVTLDASADIEAAGSLVVSGSNGESASAALSASVVEPATLVVTSGSGEFGTVVRGSSPTPRSFTIKNTGGVASTSLSASAGIPFSAGNGCDGVLAAGQSCTVDVSLDTSSDVIASDLLVVSGTGGETVSAALSASVVEPATLVVTSGSGDFGTVVRGTSPAPRAFTIKNTGGVDSSALSSAAGSPFSADGGCDGVLAAGQTCTVNVSLDTTTDTNASDSLVVSGSGGESVSTALSAAVVEDAQLTIAPPSIDFGSVVTGDTSPTQSFTITNTGGVPSGSLTGSLDDTTNFTILGSSTCTGTLAAGASCVVKVRFSPTAAGQLSATLTASASPGGQVTGTVTGLGGADATLAFLGAGTKDLGTAVVGGAPVTSTYNIKNNGIVTSGTPAFSVTGLNKTEFVATSTCGPVDPGATCAVTVTFTPAGDGERDAVLHVAGTPGGTDKVDLIGTGAEPASLTVAPVAPFAGDFGNVARGTSSANQAFLVTNTGGVGSGAVSKTLTGTNADQFTIASGAATTCNGNLAPGNTCIVSVKFTPSQGTAADNGLKTATLSVSAVQVANPATTPIQGTAVDPAALSFVGLKTRDVGTTTVGGTVSKNFTIVNSGAVASGVPSIAFTAAGAGDFTITGTTCTVALDPGATCTVSVSATPTALGQRTAAIKVTGSPGGSDTLNLTATGAPPAHLTISPTSFNFGNVVRGTASPAQQFTVTNDGGVPTAQLTKSSTGGQFTFSNTGDTCRNNVLAAGASCVSSVTFTPGATVGLGAKTGSLTFTDSVTSAITVSAAVSGTAT